MTLDEALTKIGWPKSDWETQGKDRPDCCGKPVQVRTFIGSPYYAGCEICGKFIADATGPVFHNSYVEFADSEKVEMDDHLWIAIGCAHETEAKL
jgi:hypothetical protein